MIRVKFEECLLYLKEERFYDAHESLEEIWFPKRFERSSEIQLIKGFINATVSFELYRLGRQEQSKKVWANYLKYRPLLQKLETQNQNEYYQLSRYLETINNNKLTKNSLVSY
jgi:hypothetical protein